MWLKLILYQWPKTFMTNNEPWSSLLNRPLEQVQINEIKYYQTETVSHKMHSQLLLCGCLPKESLSKRPSILQYFAVTSYYIKSAINFTLLLLSFER